jgi:NitT/TauT family transport system substrate-binding protein
MTTGMWTDSILAVRNATRRPHGTSTRRVMALLLALGTAACNSSAPGDKNSGGMVTINVAGGEGSAATTPFFVAMKQGYFKDAGLNVNYVTLSGGSTSMDAAMTSSAIDVGIGGGSQWLSDLAKGGVTGKIIGEIADNNYVILGADGITNVQQLKGKMFGILNYNTGDHLYSKAVLQHFGVQPNDVTWLAIGNPGGRLAALKAGKIAGTEMPLTNLPVEDTKRIIIGAEDSPFPFVSNAIFARQAFLASNKSALQKFVAAIGKGSDWVRAHPAEAIPACEESGATADTCKHAIATALASKNPYTWSSTGRVNMSAIKAMLPMVAQIEPRAKNLVADTVVDLSIAGAPTAGAAH